jgi:hypothetical protein
LITSFDNDDKVADDNEGDDSLMQKNIEDGQKRKKQSEWQKLEQMVIDNVKTEEEEDEKNKLNVPVIHT